MANELQFARETGLTITACVYQSDGTLISGGIACAEAGSSGLYIGDMPVASAGNYAVTFLEAGGYAGAGIIEWDGTAEITNSVIDTVVDSVRAKTAQLNFTGNDVQAIASNMRGTDGANTVAPNNTDIAAVKAQTDQLNFTGDDVQAIASNMRGTDGANTVAPNNVDIAAVRAKTEQLNFTGDDVQAIASNMRGTDGANTVAPNNVDIAAVRAKTDNLPDDPASNTQVNTRATQTSVDETKAIAQDAADLSAI